VACNQVDSASGLPISCQAIHIAPDVNYTNAVHSDKWIPILPNTDAAFQLAIAYVWMTEGLYDKEYIANHTEGFDWFEHYVLGHEDGVAKTPQWAAEKCGVPSYRIKAFARYWGTHLISIAHGNGGDTSAPAFRMSQRVWKLSAGMQGLGKPALTS
jgi:trimethylamine-N-oxide reductase (cytochrome c)